MEILKTIKTLLILGAIALTVWTVITWIRAKKPEKECVKLRTGKVGAGKSFLCSNDLWRDYKILNKAYKRRKSLFWKIFGHTSKFPPRVYSNIPFYLGKKTEKVEYLNKKGKIRKKLVRREVWSDVLTREHFLLQDLFPEDCVPLVLADELGLMCNQYAHSDPNIVSDNINENFHTVDTFIRFFRHYYGTTSNDRCRLYCTDQASGDIVIAIRRRMGFIDYLNDFRRWFGFLPFYKVDVQTMLIAEDTVSNVNNTKDEDGVRQEYYFGFLPYRFLSRKHYDSHAFHGTKYTGFTSKLNFTNWGDNDYAYVDTNGEYHQDKYKTNYCPDLRMGIAELEQYKMRLKQLKSEAIQAISFQNL